MSVSFPPEVVAAMGGAPPTDEQWRAITMPLEPSVLIAGAGSGKTSVIAARVVYLALAALGRIDGDVDGVLPGNVLALTFTVKATDNLRSRIRRALAGVELAQGEEPEILNYHGLAAQVIDRYGILAGIETGRRVLSQAQRVTFAGRVLDEMTFEHIKTEWQPSVVDKILNLDGQIANHLVDPDDVVAFVEGRLPVFKEIARTDRVYYTALERIELARAVGVFRRLKRDLGVIDFGDQIELAVQVASAHPEVGREYRDRFAAVLLDEYQDTNVAQAKLMRAMFAGGHPVTAVGDPDQNIYAWRGASLSNLFDFPTDFPKEDGSSAERLPLFTNFRSGARILHAADTIISPLPPAQRPDPAKRLVPFGPNGEGEVSVTSHRDELTEARAIADRILALHLGAQGAEGVARSEWHEIAVLCRTSRLFFLLQQTFAEREIPAEIVGLAGLLRTPEVVEVMAYARAANDAMASVALARILMGPRYRVGFKDLALVASWAKGKNYAWRDEGGDDEETPFLFAEALEHLDEVEGLSDEGRARLEEFRAELSALRVRGPSPGARVPGRGDAAHRHRRRARGRRRSRRGRPALAQPRGVPGPGARVRARRGRAHLAGLPRLRRLGRGAREGRVGTRAAERVRLGQGHDDPPSKGPRVRSRLRAGRGGGADALEAHPAEPGRARLLPRLRAARRRGDPALVRRRPLALQARSAGPGGDRGTAHDVCRAHSRAEIAARQRLELVRRERTGEGSERVLRRARRLGNDDRGGRRVDHGRWTPLG